MASYHRSWLLVSGLVMTAFTMLSCIPVTDTLYPLLTYQTARTAGAYHGGARAAFGNAARIRSEAPAGIIAARFDQPAKSVLQVGGTLGLSSRVDADADVLMGISDQTSSTGFRIGSRIRLTAPNRQTNIALQPALVYMRARDNEKDSPTQGAWETLTTSLACYELRMPVSYRVGRHGEFTFAAGVSYSHMTGDYTTNYSSYHASSIRRDWMSPLLTINYRLGFVMIEAGVHQMRNEWQSVAGLAIGKW
jgi:hypothetical protein